MVKEAKLIASSAANDPPIYRLQVQLTSKSWKQLIRSRAKWLPVGLNRENGGTQLEA